MHGNYDLSNCRESERFVGKLRTPSSAIRHSIRCICTSLSSTLFVRLVMTSLFRHVPHTVLGLKEDDIETLPSSSKKARAKAFRIAAE